MLFLKMAHPGLSYLKRWTSEYYGKLLNAAVSTVVGAKIAQTATNTPAEKAIAKPALRAELNHPSPNFDTAA